MTKKELNNKADPAEFKSIYKDGDKPKKLIMLLVDALREDFVDFERDDESEFNKMKLKHYLDYDESVYKGKKMEILTNLLMDEPENTILLPMRSEIPTVTTARIKALMTGSLTSFFEITEPFAHEILPEDNILH
jgi:predicted AlkP superfamily pyrophosphatase or phosphodiesterase